jgi:hypothetical protein
MSTYKQPVVIPNADIGLYTDPNTLKAGDVGMGKGTARVSMGDPARNDVKTSGIKQRGSGAATKGFTSRGPMA